MTIYSQLFILHGRTNLMFCILVYTMMMSSIQYSAIYRTASQSRPICKTSLVLEPHIGSKTKSSVVAIQVCSCHCTVILSGHSSLHTIHTHLYRWSHVTLMQSYQNIDCLTASPELCQVTMNQFKQLVYCSDSRLLQSLGVCMLYTSLKYTYLHGNHIVPMHGLRDTFLVPKAILEVSQVYSLFPGSSESLVIMTCNFNKINTNNVSCMVMFLQLLLLSDNSCYGNTNL